MNKTNNTTLNDTRTSANETNSKNSGDYIVKREPIGETPFYVITTDGKSFGVLGNQKVTPDFDNEEDAIQCIEEDGWGLRMAVMAFMIREANVLEWKETGL